MSIRKSAYRIKRSIEKQWAASVYRKIDVDPLSGYLLFSDPRGGSTWLAELLSQATKAPIIWEPLHLKMQAFSNLNFGWRQYIPENEDWPEAQATFEALFRGHLTNDWLASATTTSALNKADRLLFKFCRGTMLLPYLTAQFDFKNKPVYMARHPFAVVASQLKHGAWDGSKGGFEIPDIPYNELFIEHQSFLSGLNSVEEVLTATWCLTNGVALNHPGNNSRWITTTYEAMLMDPGMVIKRILDEWNIDCDPGTLPLTRKSVTTRSDSPQEKEAQLSHWKKSFNEDQLERMIRVLQYFDITLYDSGVYPKQEFS